MGEHDGTTTTEAGEGAKGTRYVVLALGEDPGAGWLPIGDYTARSAEAAVQAAAEHVDGGGLVAVPARSWRPVRVKVETVTRRTVVG